MPMVRGCVKCTCTRRQRTATNQRQSCRGHRGSARASRQAAQARNTRRGAVRKCTLRTQARRRLVTALPGRKAVQMGTLCRRAQQTKACSKKSWTALSQCTGRLSVTRSQSTRERGDFMKSRTEIRFHEISFRDFSIQVRPSQ